MATTKKTELIKIAPIENIEVMLRLRGDSPLIVHAFDAKARRLMLMDQLGWTPKTGKVKEAKNPYADFCSSMYWLDPMPEVFEKQTVEAAVEQARFGFPVTGIKQAAIAASYRLGWTKDKMSLRGVFFIETEIDHYYGGELVPDYEAKDILIIPNSKRREYLTEIKADAVIMREDMVRVGMNKADIRYRGEFVNWYTDLTVSFNKNGAYKLDDIITIINAGGNVCGIGEWRPEKDGINGRFHVESVTE